MVSATSDGIRSAKRVKASTSGSGTETKATRPRLFQPFRALGLVTDDIPFALSVRHGGKDAVKPDVNIYTCIGRSWLMWDADRMTLLFVGEAMEHDIRSLVIMPGSGGRDTVLAISGRQIGCFVRGRLTEMLTIEDEEGNLQATGVEEASHLEHLLAVGDNLLALSAAGLRLYVWSFAQRGLLRTISLDRPVLNTDDTFAATAILHPSTYVDKVLLGSRQGHLQVYNFRTATLLHTFSRASLLAYMGIEEALLAPDESFAVVDLVQTPAIDVVAVVFEAGYVLLFDIRYDEPILYARAARGNVSQGNVLGRGAVSFRSDGLAHTMAVGTRLGDVILFDLENSLAPTQTGQGSKARPAQLAHTIRAAHVGGVASVQFLQGQPLLLSNGADNAVRQWFFEADSITQSGDLGGTTSTVAATAPPRLLKTREGHSAPPRIIRYIGEGGRVILSSGGDDRSVRSISVVRDSRSAELSQGNVQKKANRLAISAVNLKLPQVTAFAHCATRSRDWDDLVTIHRQGHMAQSWLTRDSRIGKHKFESARKDRNAHDRKATAVEVSVCGNFALIGNDGGYVEMYNLQSGMHRRRFDCRRQEVQRVAKRLKGGVVQWRDEGIRLDGAAVRGIACDSINRLVAIGTGDGVLHFHQFSDGQSIAQVSTRAGIQVLLLHRPTNLLACMQEDHTITLYDIETRKQVRLFQGFAGPLLDMAFSADGRWLVASSEDGTVRTFDIPTGRLVDYFFTDQPAISLTFSPLGDFLATVHRGSRGIYLWANRNQYLNLALNGIEEAEVLRRIAMRQETAEGTEALPTLRGVDLDALAEEDAQLKELDVGEAAFQRTFTSAEQLYVSSNASAQQAGLLTLSTMPRSRWMTLLNLDMIKARNKPREAPAKPEKAPFFLPVGAGSRPVSAIERKGGEALGQGSFFDEEATNGAPPANEGLASRRLLTVAENGLDFASEFSQRLSGALQDGQMDALFLYLHALTPPALDGEIRSLVRIGDVTAFLRCMVLRLQQHRDYDAVQAMVSVALRIHGDLIVTNAVKPEEDDVAMEQGLEEEDEQRQLAIALRDLMAEQYREGNRLLDLVQYCMGSLSFVRDMPLV